LTLPLPRLSEQASNTFHETTSSCGQRTFAHGSAVLLQRGQRRGVLVRAALRRHYQIVTTVFTFGADHAGNPPDGGVIERQAFHENLQQIHQIIVPPDMRQFVQQDGFHLVGAQTCEQPHRYQDHGTKMAHDHGHLSQTGFEQGDRPGKPQSCAEAVETALPRVRWTADSGVAQASRGHPTQ